ncbi:MAG: GNAT family N-acetyltransferase [Anaerolineae bacterium]|nr:GNAT family N-acetyltransferase [Anaerolineae bacterium]
MLTSTTPYHKPLGHDLILKSLGSLDELDRLAAFNAGIHEPQLDPMTRALVLHHPHTRPEHWLYVEHEPTGQIVSSLCLIPWTWRYDDVTLRVGEMGIVGTLAEYRHRGLIRTLVTRFKELLAEGEFHLSIIQGIPYYYRQFGYEYALPLEPGWRAELHHIPDTPPDHAAGFTFRPATLDDLPVLMAMHDEAARDLDITAMRDAATWRYLFEQPSGTANLTEIWLVLDSTQQPVGYMATNKLGFGEGLIVSETARLSSAAATAALCWLKTRAIERGKPSVRLILPERATLVKMARAWAGHDYGTYAWQIHLPDAARLLRALTPVFNRRIAASPFAGMTRRFVLNLYREAFALHFERGMLAKVESLGFVDEGDMNLPPNLLAPLLLGYRSLAELRRFYPDASAWGDAALLVEALFPTMQAFIYTNY